MGPISKQGHESHIMGESKTVKGMDNCGACPVPESLRNKRSLASLSFFLFVQYTIRGNLTHSVI